MCGIDRRTSLTAAEFESEYVNKFKPVVIGAGAFAGVNDLEEIRRRWSKEVRVFCVVFV